MNTRRRDWKHESIYRFDIEEGKPLGCFNDEVVAQFNVALD